MKGLHGEDLRPPAKSHFASGSLSPIKTSDTTTLANILTMTSQKIQKPLLDSQPTETVRPSMFAVFLC